MAAETIWPTKLQIFTIWPFAAKCADPTSEEKGPGPQGHPRVRGEAAGGGGLVVGGVPKEQKEAVGDPEPAALAFPRQTPPKMNLCVPSPELVPQGNPKGPEALHTPLAWESQLHHREPRELVPVHTP